MSPIRTGTFAFVVFRTMFEICAGCARLPADEAEHKLVIRLHQPGRIDEIAAPERIENPRHGHRRLSILGGSTRISNSGSCPPWTTTVATPFRRLSLGFIS